MTRIKSYQSLITCEASVGFALTADNYGYDKASILMVQGDPVKGVVSVNVCFYIATADFTTDTSFALGTINESIMWPNSYVYFPGVEIIPASVFHNIETTAFAGTQVLDKVSLSINDNGVISAWVDTVTTSCTLSAVNHILIPVNISFTKLIEEDVAVLP